MRKQTNNTYRHADYVHKGLSKCLSFPYCQYTASLDLDTFPEIFLSAIIGSYDCEKGLLTSTTARQHHA